MTARPDEFRKALSRAVLAHKCVELRAVLMLEAPADAAHLTVRKQLQQLQHLLATALACQLCAVRPVEPVPA